MVIFYVLREFACSPLSSEAIGGFGPLAGREMNTSLACTKENCICFIHRVANPADSYVYYSMVLGHSDRCPVCLADERERGRRRLPGLPVSTNFSHGTGLWLIFAVLLLAYNPNADSREPGPTQT